MEIINAHVHAIDLMGMANRYPGASLPSGISALSHLEQMLPLLDPSEIIRQMDDANISQAVLFSVEAPIVYSSNEYVAELCQKYPDRFIGFASTDPKKSNALDVIKNAVEVLGMKGLKFHPPLQDFYPNDERVFPLYQAAQEWGIPVVFHVGSTPFGRLCRLDQANPLLIDDVAIAFPELQIMLTHLGTLWQNEAFMVVEKNPNVFIDTAAYLYEIGDILTENLIARIGEDKIIFGTDYPMPSPPHKVHAMGAFVERIEQLPLMAKTKEKIFSTNFKRMLDPSRFGLLAPVSLKDIVEHQQRGAEGEKKR